MGVHKWGGGVTRPETEVDSPRTMTKNKMAISTRQWWEIFWPYRQETKLGCSHTDLCIPNEVGSTSVPEGPVLWCLAPKDNA
jgi:hypothetical protein